MDDEKLCAIASESEDIRRERTTLKQKLGVLESGKQVLFEHIGKDIQESSLLATRSDVSNKQCGPHPLGQSASQLLPISDPAWHPVGPAQQAHDEMSRREGMLHPNPRTSYHPSLAISL